VGSLQLLATVTDVMGHVVEHHEYDGTGRAITSERQNGIDKYTLAYGTNETDVTDAEGHLVKYTFQEINAAIWLLRSKALAGVAVGHRCRNGATIIPVIRSFEPTPWANLLLRPLMRVAIL